jgi:hypothetical protein
MSITKFYEEMQKDFYLPGQIGKNFYHFEIDKDYEGFLANSYFDVLVMDGRIAEFTLSPAGGGSASILLKCR